MEQLKELAKMVRSRRGYLKYTQTDIAELTGLTDRTIRAIESGGGGTAIQSWAKILDVLGLELKVQIKPLSDETRKGVLQ